MNFFTDIFRESTYPDFFNLRGKRKLGGSGGGGAGLRGGNTYLEVRKIEGCCIALLDKTEKSRYFAPQQALILQKVSSSPAHRLPEKSSHDRFALRILQFRVRPLAMLAEFFLVLARSLFAGYLGSFISFGSDCFQTVFGRKSSSEGCGLHSISRINTPRLSERK